MQISICVMVVLKYWGIHVIFAIKLMTPKMIGDRMSGVALIIQTIRLHGGMTILMETMDVHQEMVLVVLVGEARKDIK